MTEWQILFDTINIGWSEDPGVAQRPPALGILALKQVAPTGAPEEHFTGAGYLETLCHGLFGFNAFGTSHNGFFIGSL